MLKYLKTYITLAFLLIVSINSVAQESSPADERNTLKRAHVFHIMLQDYNQANSIYRKLQESSAKNQFEEFKKLAREKSIDPGSKDQGGDLGTIESGRMDKSFEDAMFASSVGVVSKPIKSKWGWHLIFLESLTKEPISEICQKSLPVDSPSAPGRYQLALAMTRAPYSATTIQTEVREILGDNWGPVLANEKGGLETYKLEALSVNAHRLISHVELSYALLDVKNYSNETKTSGSPTAVCIRSVQHNYSIDCGSGKMYYDGYSAYELRGGLGRLVTSETFDPAKRPIVKTVSQRKGEMIANVCNGRKIDVNISEY